MCTRQYSFKVCNRLLFVQYATCNLAKTLFLNLISSLLFIHDIAWKHEFWEVRISLDIWKNLEFLRQYLIHSFLLWGRLGFFGCSFNICCEFKREKILFWTCYTEALRRWLYGRTEFVSTLAVPSDSLFTFGTGLRMKITDGEEKMSSCFLFEMWKTKAWTDLTHLVCFCF